MDLHIRPYQPADRQALRQIFLATADAGASIRDLVPDTELLASLWTDYYLTEEPEHVWVAENDRKAVGYLMATFDAQRFVRYQQKHLVDFGIKALGRGILFNRQWWSLIALNRHLWRLLFIHHASPPGPAGHLHINLLPEARRHHVGQRLWETCLAAVRQSPCREMVIGTLEENKPAQNFFESLGFQKRYRELTFRLKPADGGWKIVYAFSL